MVTSHRRSRTPMLCHLIDFPTTFTTSSILRSISTVGGSRSAAPFPGRESTRSSRFAHCRACVQNTRHICVEGWDVIGRFGDAQVGDFLDHIGADPSASFVLVTCADGYYESLDRALTRHPQSLLCYEMYDRPLDRCGDPSSFT